MTVVASMFFMLELFNMIGHLFVSLRIRLLPRRDLTRLRWYFFLDFMSPLFACLLYTEKLRWLVLPHAASHLYPLITWNKSHFAVKIINWSTLDWIKSGCGNTYEWDIIITVGYDITMHGLVTLMLMSHMDYIEIPVCAVAVIVFDYFVHFSGKFAWCNPNSIPEWVARRMRPLSHKLEKF